MNELKPCPFCGETSSVHLITRHGKDGWRDYHYVLCDYNEGGCGASGQWNHYEEEAIEAWNRRIEGGYSEQSVRDAYTDGFSDGVSSCIKNISQQLMCDAKTGSSYASTDIKDYEKIAKMMIGEDK